MTTSSTSTQVQPLRRIRNAAQPDARAPRSSESRGARQRHWRTLLLVGASYLLLSVFTWWSVWSDHPTTNTVCGCGDPSLFTWFLDWPAYAIAHGLNPFYSTAMGYPHGVNLLANTSEVGLGLLLAPVTWIFGPIATLNVSLTLAPFLSALAMFVLLQRWTSWAPAAFIGGLLYGFSPLILSNSGSAHLQVTMLVVPPLAVACLDELLFRQHRRPVTTGVLLGVLVAVQFFLGTEILAITVICGILGLGLVIIHARWQDQQVLRERAPFALSGLKAAAVTAVVLLAFPAWFALFGPASLPGPIWPVPLSQYASHLKWYVLVPPATNTDQYLGLGLALVLLCGLLIWRRDRRLWLFGTVGLISIVLALGTLDPIFSLFPLLENIVPTRFNAVVYLAVAVMLGIILDHVYAAVSSRMANRLHQPAGHHRSERLSRFRGWARLRLPRCVGASAAILVAAAALLPIASEWSQGIPIAISRVAIPSWFKTSAARSDKHQVLLVFPDAVSQESPMTWQTLDDMRYAMVDEGGPGGATTRGGKERVAENVLAIVSSANTGYSARAKVITPEKIARVQQALTAWKVTTVVIPAEPSLPYYDSVPSVRIAAGLMTAATGQRPIHKDGAWVWTNVDHSGPPILVSATTFAVCTSDKLPGNVAVDFAAVCVMKSAVARTGTAAA
jgi:hypothetical protein